MATATSGCAGSRRAAGLPARETRFEGAAGAAFADEPETTSGETGAPRLPDPRLDPKGGEPGPCQAGPDPG